MKRCIATLLTLLALSAQADYIASNGADSVRIQDAPCAESILALIPPDAREQFRSAVANVGGKEYAACWAMLPDGTVFLQYADGDAGMIPVSAFRPAP